MNRIKNNTRFCGFSLVELLLAMLVIAIVAFPLVRSVTLYYSIAAKQQFQEQALKIAEGAINKFLSIEFERLENLSGKEINFNYYTSSSDKEAKIKFETEKNGSCTITIGNVNYNLEVLVDKVFDKIENPLSFYFLQKEEFLGNYKLDNSLLPAFLKPPPPGYSIATYPSPDSVFWIHVQVTNNHIKPVDLDVLRCDLRK